MNLVTLQKQVERRYFTGLLSIAYALLLMAWAFYFINGDDAYEFLLGSSKGIRNIELDTSVLEVAALLVSLLAVYVCTRITFSAPHWLVAFTVVAFAYSDAGEFLTHTAALAIRYLAILMIVALGLLALSEGTARMNSMTQMAGLAIVGWIGVSILLHGLTSDSAFFIAFNFFTFVGIVAGFALIYQHTTLIDKTIKAIAYASVYVTCFNALSFVLAKQPYISGRFTGWNLLPTSFGGNYVYFVISLLWAAFYRGEFKFRWLCIAAIPPALFMILLSGTRNAIAAISISSVLMVLTMRREWWLAALGLAAASALGAVVYLTSSSHDGLAAVGRIGTVVDSSTMDRVRIWQESWRLFLQQPILGQGMGEAVLTNAFADLGPGPVSINVHNAYLGLLLRLGLLGLLTHLFFYYAVGQQAVKLVRWPHFSTHERAALIWSAVLVLVTFLMGAFEENFRAPRGSLVVVVLALSGAFVAALSKRLNISVSAAKSVRLSSR